MKARSAKNKGSRYENYLVERLRKEVDENTHKQPGSGAGLDKNDIRIPSLNLEIEAKNKARLTILSDWEQAERQTTPGNMTVLAVRHPKHPEFKKSLIIIDLEDFIALLQSQKEETHVVADLDPQLKWKIQAMVDKAKAVIKELNY